MKKIKTYSSKKTVYNALCQHFLKARAPDQGLEPFLAPSKIAKRLEPSSPEPRIRCTTSTVSVSFESQSYWAQPGCDDGFLSPAAGGGSSGSGCTSGGYQLLLQLFSTARTKTREKKKQTLKFMPRYWSLVLSPSVRPSEMRTMSSGDDGTAAAASPGLLGRQLKVQKMQNQN
jgi:hypothetical protein